MFIKNADIDEIAYSLEYNIINLENAENDRMEERRANALNYLMVAANLLDEAELEIEASMVTQILAKFAEHDSTSNLTSEKMLSNLEHIGWVFNASDNELEVSDEPKIEDELNIEFTHNL